MHRPGQAGSPWSMIALVLTPPSHWLERVTSWVQHSLHGFKRTHVACAAASTRQAQPLGRCRELTYTSAPVLMLVSRSPYPSLHHAQQVSRMACMITLWAQRFTERWSENFGRCPISVHMPVRGFQMSFQNLQIYICIR